MEEEEVSDVDVYVSDIDRDDGEDEEIMNRMEDEIALDELETNMTEDERTRIGNEMIMNEIENEDVILPDDVEFESNEDLSDNDDDDDLKFLREDEMENNESAEDMGDFFEEKGVHHGQLNIE